MHSLALARIDRRARRAATLAVLAGALVIANTAMAFVTLSFDEVVLGTVLDHHYAARGVTFEGVGNGGPFAVVAAEPCVDGGSTPHSLSILPFTECPEVNDSTGWIRITFAAPQPRVSVMVSNAGPGTLSYLKAFRDDGSFLDVKFGQVGDAWAGVPQRIEIERAPEDPWIGSVELGAFAGGQGASFDDLSFDVTPVAVGDVSFGTMKSRFGRD